MGASIAVAARGLARSFPGGFRLAVENLTLSAGGIYGFAGPNGSGKTTLLETLGLLAAPDAGELEILGRKVAPGTVPREARLRIAFVMQKPYLFRGTVAGNIAYGLAARRVPAKARESRIRDAMEIMGLTLLAGADTRLLSGGETQRVALARALALETPILVLDEPAAHLDDEYRGRLEERIADLRGRTTVLFSSHDPSAAGRVCDRVFVLENGSIA